MTTPLVDLKGRSPWSVLPPLVMGFFMVMVDMTIVNIAVPSIQKSLDADLTSVGWVNSGYLLSFAVLMLPAGRLGDRYGPRMLFLSGLVVFTAASALCGLADSISLLIAARVIQGVGAALMTPQTMAVITRVFPAKSRGAALGIWGMVAGLATIAGPVLGGFIVEDWGWEWIFYVNIPVGVVAIVYSVVTVPHLETHKRYFDVVGTLLAVAGLFLLVFGLQEGENYDWGKIWGPVTIWELIGAGLVVLGVFLVWQHRLGDKALLPLRLFHYRNFSLANVSAFMISFAMLGIFFPLTIFLQSILGLSPLAAAMVNLPASLLSGIVAPFAGRLSDRINGKWVVATGFGFIAVSLLLVYSVLTPDVSEATLIWCMIPFGIGTGLVFSPMVNLATAGLDHRTAGAGAGAFNTIRQVGSVVGSAAIVAMLTGRLATTIPNAAHDVAAGLPADLRQPFATIFSGGDVSADTIQQGFQPPAGVTGEAAKRIGAAAQQAVGDGFTVAVKDTLLLVVAALVAGGVAALFMSPTRRASDDAVPAAGAGEASEEPAAV
ncbi:DHA2 family efflux MFS transporter permease subunit [Luteimicrobium xylanilyticum]|uniref:Tartrate transporter n=1 Tax=Luteimicrobium xylanilyticum TaxID=1133546 RepID=A0A5P9Q8T5_9MICO|nr:DHA2 family efflux MFS transporter permease subunit [Luteimicrobium xylanilyticum]QFU97560.1 Putative tartrate transporter [Luteimicrobium xylanilyticum]